MTGPSGKPGRPGDAERSSAAEPRARQDVVLIHGRSDDGALKVLRKKGDELSAGELRPLQEGKPITGDVLRLKPRRELPLLCDVEEEIVVERPRSGPPQVATDRYRAGWEALWGRREDPDALPS